jgi:hypothetical protein
MPALPGLQGLRSLRRMMMSHGDIFFADNDIR